MQIGKSIINIPLLICILLSAAAHVAVLCSKGLYTPPKQIMKSGRTVVQLTLIPSAAASAPEVPESEKVLTNSLKKPDTPLPKPLEPEPVATPPKKILLPIPLTGPVPEEPTKLSKPEIKAEQEKQTKPPEQKSKADSIEQIASLIEDKGVTTTASPSQAIQPTYPRKSQRRGEQGTVILSIRVLANGSPGSIIIKQSSGYKGLDEAAVKAAKAADYVAAKQFGRSIDSELTQPVVFRLTGER